MNDSIKPVVKLSAQQLAPSTSPRVRSGVRAGLTIKQKVTG
ncbi:MAG: hypothetical protein U0326_08955 [Polyangiales bacterium]